MRLLLDMGLPRRCVDDLATLGWDATHVGALGRERESDAGILELARAESRIVVTHDADFSRLLALARATAPSVIHLRIPRLTRILVTSLLPPLLTSFQTELEAGAVLSVSEGSARVRLLPLV